MQNLGTRARIAVVSSLVVVWAVLGYACAVEDENPGSPRKVDAGSLGEGGVDPQGKDAAPLGAPICGKYGGYENVKTISAAIIARVAADCRIGGPIANLNPDQSQHLGECFEIQLGGAFQCPGISYTGGTTKDSKGKNCRDMTAAHKGLNLRAADFNAFVDDINAELAAAGLTPDELRAIAPVWEGTEQGVVQQNNQPTRNTHCSCADGLYEGKPCLPEAGIVDAAVPDTSVADAADAADGN